jgi:penicillin amidase
LVFEAWSAAVGALAMNRLYAPDIRRVLGGRVDWSQVARLLRTPGVGDTLALAGLDSAGRVIAHETGASQDVTSAAWGQVHIVQFKHPIASAFDLPSLARSGDANTVMATGGPNFRQTAGASYREIIDLGDFDNSVAINVPGESAQPGSEHYSDLLQSWADGAYFPLVYSRRRVEAETRHILWLVPRR